MSARLSVVIPVWGGPYRATLPAAVASARAAGARVIVVTLAAEPQLEPLGELTEIQSDGPLSVGRARNLGLAAVQTPYVIFLDADDTLLPGAVEAMLTAAEAHPGALAVVTQVLDRESSAIVAPRRGAGALSRNPGMLGFANAIWSLLPMQGSTLMSAEAVRGIGGYADADGGEDWALGVALALSGPIILLDLPGLLYSSSRGRPGALPRREMKRRAALARARWREHTGGRGRAALPLIALVQLLLIEVVRPLAGRLGLAGQRPVPQQRPR